MFLPASGPARAGLTLFLTFAAAHAQEPPVKSLSADTVGVIETEKVEITGRRASPIARESEHVAKIPLKNLENPQAYTIVTKELTKQQIAVDYNSAFKNIAGATKSGQYMQGGSQFYTRGFSSSTEMRNGLSVGIVTDIDPVNTERLEGVRGPAGALFGAGSGTSYGGLFNRVTKEPLPTRQGEISYSAGSWNLNRLTADFNTPLNDDKTLLLRVGAARHLEGSHLDQGFTDAWAFAPSISYQVSDRLKLSLDAEFYKRVGTSVPQARVQGTTVRSMKDLGWDYRRSFLDNSIVTESRTQNIYAAADYRINANWSSQTVLSTTSSASDLQSIYLDVFNDSLARRTYDAQAWKVYTRQVQQNFRGTFNTAFLRHQALVGLAASNGSYTWPYTLYNDTVNFVNPGADYFVGQDLYRARSASVPLSMWTQDLYTYSVYAADAIHFADRLTLLLAARWDRFEDRGSTDMAGYTSEDYAQNTLSPRVGLVVQPLKDRVALFASAMSGFRNVGGRAYDSSRFVPEHALQSEVGVKVQAPGGLFSGTFSVYDIKVEDLTRADPVNAGYQVQDGNQESQGFEAEIAARPLEGLTALAGYSYNVSKLVKADPDVEGRRPASAGPAQAANFWVSYETPRGLAKGLGAGLGANYVGEAYHKNTSTYVFTVPAYTLWDATVFYNAPKYRVAVKVDNLTDEEHWTPETLTAGPTRRVLADVTYKF